MRLEGVDGSHLLGFMTALGTLRLLDEDASERGLPRPRLSFDSRFVAELSGIGDDRTVTVTALTQRLASRQRFYCRNLADVSKPSDFTAATFASAARSAARWQQDALSGLACDTGADEVAESTLCAANGASHQELIRSIRDVLALVLPEHLDAALFRNWSKDYSIPQERRKALGLGSRKPTLRLDPADERLYALRATNPTPPSSEYKTELGAQALAVPAFELLPVCPSRRSQCISSRREPGRVIFEYGLWNVPATLSSVRSLLAVGPRDAVASRGWGVFAAFSVARVTGEKGKLSITPTLGLWLHDSSRD